MHVVLSLLRLLLLQIIIQPTTQSLRHQKRPLHRAPNKMNYLVIATGANLGDPIEQLTQAKNHLSNDYELLEESRVYCSQAVDYLNQPDFFNQVLLFKLPDQSASQVMENLLKIETKLGRERIIKRGPRTIDIDIIFYGEEVHSSQALTLPHPRFLERSFVVRPLLELSLADWLHEKFQVPDHFATEAHPFS